MGTFGTFRYLSYLGHFWTIWAILDHFGPFLNKSMKTPFEKVFLKISFFLMMASLTNDIFVKGGLSIVIVINDYIHGD